MSEPKPAPGRALDSFLDGLCEEGIVPGGAAAIVGAEGLLWSRCFGHRALEPEPEPSSEATRWDLASLTKPLVTASLALRARERGELDFAAPVDRLLPELVGELRTPTVAELLTHSAGLTPWAPLSALVDGGLSERARWLAERREEPGRRAVYGCCGYQLLGLMLERLTGRSLAEQAREELWPSRDDLHLPLPVGLWYQAAPTERGNRFEARLAADWGVTESSFRSGLIRGETHDANAWSLGGAAGNAGLFASLGGAAFLAGRFLTPGFFTARTLAELSEDQVAEAARGEGSEQRSWGFQLARSENSCAGPVLSDRAFGHAGFTGTSLLVDPDRAAAFLLLTNRVHPEWTERAFHADRRRFHELAADWLEAERG